MQNLERLERPLVNINRHTMLTVRLEWMAKNKLGAQRGIPETKKKSLKKRLLEELRGYTEAFVIAYFVITFLFNTVGVVGSSMQPNLNGGIGSGNILQSLLTGDRVFIPKYDNWLRRMKILGPYRRGEIVVVREPQNSPTAQERGRRPFFIKRIIAIPGDTVRIEAGQVYVNDYPINQDFISGTGLITPDAIDFPLMVLENGEVSKMAVQFANTPRGTPFPLLASTNFPPTPIDVRDPRIQLYYSSTIKALASPNRDVPNGTPVVLNIIVPKQHYFLMGDNRESLKGGSEDSRFFGPVRSLTIAGRATAVIWPPRREGNRNWRVLKPPKAFDAIPQLTNQN